MGCLGGGGWGEEEEGEGLIGFEKGHPSKKSIHFPKNSSGLWKVTIHNPGFDHAINQAPLRSRHRGFPSATRNLAAHQSLGKITSSLASHSTAKEGERPWQEARASCDWTFSGIPDRE